MVTPRGAHLAFTGHRPPKLGGWERPNPVQEAVSRVTRERLLHHRPERAYTGMALGYDQLAAWVCVELRIPFVAVVPFRGQEDVWPNVARREYRNLLRLAAEVVVLAERYDETRLQIRNEWMVDKLDQPQDVLLACFDGTRGGTANCLRYAHERGLTNIDIIGPELWRRV